MSYSEKVLDAAKKALTDELGSITKMISRGIVSGKAIRNNLWNMNKKIVAATKIGISKAKPLNQAEDFETLAKEIEPLTQLAYNSPTLKDEISGLIRNFFIEKTGIESEFTLGMHFPPRLKP